jgi:hypothetical protein
MRVTPVTGRGALALFIASHESSFKVPSDCYTTATHRVMGFIVERASHVRKCPRCNEAPQPYRGFGSFSTASGTSMSGERSTIAVLMNHIPMWMCSWYVIQLRDPAVHVQEEFMLEAGGTKARDFRLEVRRIRPGASRDRHEDVAWLVDLRAPHTPSSCR